MKFKSFCLFVWLISTISFPNAIAQFSQADREDRAKFTKADYVQMLEQLSIEESDLRPGPSGNPTEKLLSTNMPMVTVPAQIGAPESVGPATIGMIVGMRKSK